MIKAPAQYRLSAHLEAQAHLMELARYSPRRIKFRRRGSDRIDCRFISLE
jgi:hypothetical protein